MYNDTRLGGLVMVVYGSDYMQISTLRKGVLIFICKLPIIYIMLST